LQYTILDPFFANITNNLPFIWKSQHFNSEGKKKLQSFHIVHNQNASTMEKNTWWPCRRTGVFPKCNKNYAKNIKT
jgi:hypothetical protein